MNEIIRLYHEGKSRQQIQEIVGVSQPTIRKTLRKAGIKIQPYKVLTDTEKSEIVRLSEDGLSSYAIAEQIGCDARTVRRVLKQSQG